MMFSDSHCHLDFKELQSGYIKLLSQCSLHNIHQIIIPAISPDNWDDVLSCGALTNDKSVIHNKQKTTFTLPQCFPALGIHPWFLKGLELSALNKLEKKVSEHRGILIAIGETGIDKPIAEQQNNLGQQIEFFNAQIQLAHSQKLPLIVHHRNSHELIIKQLKLSKFELGGILHAFSGSYQQAKQYIDLGFKLGVGGTITYPRAKKTIKAIEKLPLSSLVLETDAPAMPLHGFQGSINTPLRVIDVFKHLCKIRDEEKEFIAESLENNIQDFLNLSRAHISKPSN